MRGPRLQEPGGQSPGTALGSCLQGSRPWDQRAGLREMSKSVAQRARSHRDSNSDRWIQSPECSPLHHGTAHSSLGPAAEPGPTQPRGPGPGPGPASRPARSSAAPSPLPPRPRREGPASPALGRPSELNLEDEKKSIGVGDRAGLSGLPQVCLLCGISRMFCPEESPEHMTGFRTPLLEAHQKQTL